MPNPAEMRCFMGVREFCIVPCGGWLAGLGEGGDGGAGVFGLEREAEGGGSDEEDLREAEKGIETAQRFLAVAGEEERCEGEPQ